MSATSAGVVKLSIEVITLPVGDVARALRFYLDQVGFTPDVDYSPNDTFRVVQLTPPGSSCSIQIVCGLTDAAVGSLCNAYLVVTHLDAVRNRLLECGVEVGEIRHKIPSMPETEVSHPGSAPRAGTTPASPTSRIRMAQLGVAGTRLPQCMRYRGSFATSTISGIVQAPGWRSGRAPVFPFLEPLSITSISKRKESPCVRSLIGRLMSTA